MQRPVMNPTFYEEAADNAARGRFRAVRVVWKLLWRTIRTAWRLLTYDPLKRRLRVEDGPSFMWFLRGVMYRLAFVPLFVAAAACAVVYAATHPRSFPTTAGENSPAELYSDAVTLTTSDRISLEATVYPVIDARQVLAEKEQALRKRYPAVVLVHDFGMDRQQMHPLIRPLHDAGFVVLAMNLRGNGGSGAAAQTFGLREQMDVKAAVEELRRRSFVDPKRVVVVAAGTGATAAMLHAKQDPAIPALVVINPIKSVDELLETRIMPRQRWLGWMKPLCKWTFEIGYQLDTDDVEWSEFDRLREQRPVLVLGESRGHTDLTRTRHQSEIRSFLIQQVVEPTLPTAKAAE